MIPSIILNESALTHNNDSSSSMVISSPMSCRVSTVKVKAGQSVKKGEVIMVLEAMKMEHLIKAPRDAKIKKICFIEGQLVGEKKPLVEFSE